MIKLSLFTSLLAFCSATVAQASAPVTALPPAKLVVYNQSYYKDGQFIDKFMGKLAAIEVTVTQTEPGPKDGLILKTSLTDPGAQPLWIASLATINKEMIKVGSKLRVLGYFDKTSEEKEYMAKLSQDPEYLLGFCFYDVDSGRPMYYPQWQQKCLKWENGVVDHELSH